MNKPITLLWLSGVLETFADTLTYQLPLSPIVIQAMNDVKASIESYIRNRQLVAQDGLKTTTQQLLGIMRAESTLTL
jgi:hypothetical protein